MSLHLAESLKTQLAAALTIKILMPPLYLYTPSRRSVNFSSDSLAPHRQGSLFLFHGITYFIAGRVRARRDELFRLTRSLDEFCNNAPPDWPELACCTKIIVKLKENGRRRGERPRVKLAFLA